MCADYGIESGKSLVQLKEKWKSLFEKYNKINDNKKATGRGREKFRFFDVMDSFLGFSDKVNRKFVSETNVSCDARKKHNLLQPLHRPVPDLRWWPLALIVIRRHQ